MKKNNLFKAVGIVILAYILLSWIAPMITSSACTETQKLCQIGITNIFAIFTETFSGFGTVVLFVFMVGAFYGVLKVTGAYDKMINAWTNKATGKEKLWLVIIICAMALISSVAGLDLGILVLFPILIGFITRLGYNKLVALSSTVGAVIIGMYGAVFNGSIYGLNNSLLSLGKYDQILVKIIFFVIGLGALITFVLMYVKANKKAFNKKAIKLDVKKETSTKAKKTVSKAKTAPKKVAASKPKSKSEVKGERSALPGFIIFGLLVLVLLLGTIAWGNIFSSNWFETAHTGWTQFKISGFDIVNKLFGGVAALGNGYWFQGPKKFQTYSMLLLIAMVFVTIFYKKSPKEAFEGFVDGMKSFVVPVIITVIVCSVFVFTFYSPIISNITSGLLGDQFNIVTTGLYAILNSVFYLDYYYLTNMLFPVITGKYSDASTISIISVMFANLYALVMLAGPTSLLLLVSLSIAEVNYTDWFKFIGKLALSLLFVSFAVFSFMISSIVVGIVAAGLAVLIFGFMNNSKVLQILSIISTFIALAIYFFIVTNILLGIIFSVAAVLVLVLAIITRNK